jgi:DHA2 family multidrug resistance protein-like MFS transporter
VNRIDLALFRIPAFRASLVLYGGCILMSFGGFIFLPQYLQLVVGLSSGVQAVFGSKSISKSRTELVVFLTPRVLRAPTADRSPRDAP